MTTINKDGYRYGRQTTNDSHPVKDANASKTDYTKYSPKQIERAKLEYKRFSNWASVNRDAMEYVSKLVEQSAKDNRIISGRYLVEQIRKKDFVDIHGNRSMVSNNVAEMLPRYLIIKNPSLRSIFIDRGSIYNLVVFGRESID